MQLKWKSFNICFLLASLAFLVGILAGFGAILFRGLTAFVHNLLFSGYLSFSFIESHHTQPSIWGVGVILVPVIGGLIVIWLIKKFAFNQTGLSVPEIMYKVRHEEGKIQPQVAITKTIASAISIGSGASIGREGPVIQIGAAISSLIGSFIHLSVEQKRILIAAGAAASTAAMFNAPIAGIAMAIELLLLSLRVFSVLPVLIAAITAGLLNHLITGGGALFIVENLTHTQSTAMTWINLIFIIPLGLMTGLASVLFIQWVYQFEDWFGAFFKNPYIRHMTGMAIVGIMLYVFMKLFGHYYIEGVGFATIQDCINTLILNPWLLILLIICKLLATCLSLGTGASGGVFSPVLFLGATIGTLLGLTLQHFFPDMGINLVLFTIAGMAGMLGSSTGAVFTAIVLTIEITQDFNAILPVIITTLIAHGTRKLLCRESVYTLQLVREKKRL